MLLSIIPSCGSDDSFEVKKQNLDEKRFSFSSPFGQIAKNKVTTNANHDNRSNKKIGVHVAGPEVLLPLIDRPKEVKTLLQNTESGNSIFQQLQKVHLPYSKEWETIQQILFEQNRDDIGDREWLKELHLIIFARSPRLWCHFSECIGARDVRLDVETFDDMESSIAESEDVCTSDSVVEEVQLPTFEFLKQLPSTYRKPVDQIDTISIDDRHYAESVDEMTNSLKKQEVRNISSESSESFIGLRIRLRSRSESNDGQGNISPLSIGSNADTGLGIRNASIRSRSRSSSTLSFRKQRRLSQLFLSAPISTSSPIEIPQKPLHGRHRSASSRGESEMFAGEGDAQWYRQFRQRDLECGITEPVSLLLNRNPTWQSFAPPSSQKNANMEGLLPDGRTRHPSAGSGEMKASLATFRKDNQITGTSSSESSSPISIGLSPSASMQVEVDNNGNCLRWPSSIILPISPITDSSDRSMPQTPGENHTILSPITAFTPIESSTKELSYTENATFGSFSDPLSTVLRSSKSHNFSQTKQAPSTVIFPVPPCAQVSRVDELTNQLDQQNFVGDEDEKRAILEAFTLLGNTIGSQGIHQLQNLIRKAGERDRTTDEDLLRSIASNCFGLVDMDLAIENGGKILCGPSGFDDKHKRFEAEQKMKKQPWYTLQHNLITSSSTSNQDQIQQTDQDHEARVQTYYEDVDAYAKRFIAFDALLSAIWNVDCTIMHTVRQRCGPVGNYDFKQHKQTTKMTDKYLTKATY